MKPQIDLAMDLAALTVVLEMYHIPDDYKQKVTDLYSELQAKSAALGEEAVSGADIIDLLHEKYFK